MKNLYLGGEFYTYCKKYKKTTTDVSNNSGYLFVAVISSTVFIFFEVED